MSPAGCVIDLSTFSERWICGPRCREGFLLVDTWVSSVAGKNASGRFSST